MAFPTEASIGNNAERLSHPKLQPNNVPPPSTPVAAVSKTLDKASSLAEEVRSLADWLFGPIPQPATEDHSKGASGVMNDMMTHAERTDQELNEAFAAIRRIRTSL